MGGGECEDTNICADIPYNCVRCNEPGGRTQQIVRTFRPVEVEILKSRVW